MIFGWFTRLIHQEETKYTTLEEPYFLWKLLELRKTQKYIHFQSTFQYFFEKQSHNRICH